MQDLLQRMTARVLRHTSGIEVETALPRIALGVVRQAVAPTPMVSAPAVCIILQGSKQMLVGDRLLRFGPGSCFVALSEMAAARFIFEPRPGRPYVSSGLSLASHEFAALAAEFDGRPVPDAMRSSSLLPASPLLIEAWDRHLALLDTPEEIPFLGAARERELLYRLLTSAHGAMLQQIARQDGPLAQVRRAIEWMRQHIDRPVPVKILADKAGMSVPSFNRHFKAATSTSPLQFQKILRLQAARQALTRDPSATRAAYAVGYESTSQFNREYARLFGLPPRQDAARLRRDMAGIASAVI